MLVASVEEAEDTSPPRRLRDSSMIAIHHLRTTANLMPNDSNSHNILRLLVGALLGLFYEIVARQVLVDLPNGTAETRHVSIIKQRV
jgi:hypothetical protein